MTDTVRIIVEVDVDRAELGGYATSEDIAVFLVKNGSEEDPGFRVVDVELLA